MSEVIHHKLLQQTRPYPLLHRAITENGVQSLEPKPEHQFFPYLARSVAGQQLSNAAAKTIWQRVEALVQPERELRDLFVAENTELLRGCGLSAAKIRTLCGVRHALCEREIDPHRLAEMPLEAMIRALTQLWGIGPWTAEMTAIFFFARPDVWSKGDAALQRGLSLLAEKEGVSGEEILALVTPYRSYLALHVWQCLDTDLLTALAG